MKKIIRGFEAGLANIFVKIRYSKYVIFFFSVCYKYKVFVSIVQLIILIIGFIFFEEYFQKERVLSVIILAIILLFGKYIYIYFLKYLGGNGYIGSQWPIKKLRKFFKEYKLINKILIFYMKYFNLYRLLLIIRNIITIGLRYVRYVFLKVNLFYFGIKIEKILTIFCNFIYDYIFIIVDDIYLTFKKNLLKMNIKEFLRGRIKLILLICLTQGLIKFIYLILILTIVKLLIRNLLVWAYDLERGNDIYSSDLNQRLFNHSNMLKNLNFSPSERYIGYKKIIPVVDMYVYSKDTLYPNLEKLRFFDIYKGLRITELGDLNFAIKNLFYDRVKVDYCLSDKDCQEYGEGLEEVQKILKKEFQLIKEIISELEKNNIILNPKVEFSADYLEPKLCFELSADKEYLKKILKNKKEISIEDKIDEIQKLDYQFFQSFTFTEPEDKCGMCRGYYEEYFLGKYKSKKPEIMVEISEKYIKKWLVEEILEKKI